MRSIIFYIDLVYTDVYMCEKAGLVMTVWQTRKTDFLNASVRTKKLSSDKAMPHDQMHWLKTLIFTPLRFM